MIDSKLIQEAIEDAKALRLLCLAWTEGQFFGHMKYKSWDSNEVERASCNCHYCHQSMSLESSSSHAQICRCPVSASYIIHYDTQRSQSYETQVLSDGTEKFHCWLPPSFCGELEKRIKEGRFGKVEKYTWG